jgi:hypothetical protein
MAGRVDSQQCSVLPIADRDPVGLVTFDAKDPETSFPPIEPLRPPKNAPNVLIRVIPTSQRRRAVCRGGNFRCTTAIMVEVCKT